MTPLKQFQAAESSLPARQRRPARADQIEYGEASIVALWHDPKAAVVVDPAAPRRAAE